MARLQAQTDTHIRAGVAGWQQCRRFDAVGGIRSVLDQRFRAGDDGAVFKRDSGDSDGCDHAGDRVVRTMAGRARR